MRRASQSAPAFAPASNSEGTVHESHGIAPGTNSASRSLREFLPTAKFVSAKDIQFRSIAESSELAAAGDLVVYRTGEQDPTKLIADAMARGAAGLLTEQLLPCPLPQCVVGDVDAAAAEIWSECLGQPDRKLISIGVLGSAGKTTTSLLLANLFRGLGARTAFQTDLGESDGIVQTTRSAEVPSGESLVRWYKDASDCESQVAIVEITDDAMRHGRYEAVRFDVLVVTGTVRKNDDYGPSTLQCALERLASDGVAVVPADDRRAMRIVLDSGVRRVTYATRGAADVTVKQIGDADGLSTLFIGSGDVTAVMETPLCGSAMAGNHAAAAAVGVLVDQSLPWIAETLGSLRCVPGRMQTLNDLHQADVTIDAAGDAHRASAALARARQQRNGGRLWCVIAIDGTESAEELARYGELAERHADHAILTCRAECKKQFLKLAHQVLDGVRECAALRLVADQQRAVRWAVAEAASRDKILLLGGVTRQSAQHQRKELRSMEQWVKSERAAREAAAARKPAGATESAVPFKIVG